MNKHTDRLYIWMDGREKEAQRDRLTYFILCGRTDGLMDRQTDGRTDRQTGIRMGRQTDGQKDGRTEGCTDEPTDR
jgi:hypothetical protein